MGFAQYDDQTPYPPIPNHLEAVDTTWSVERLDTMTIPVSITRPSRRFYRNEAGGVVGCDPGDPDCAGWYWGEITLTEEVEVIVPSKDHFTQRVLVPRDGFDGPVPELPTVDTPNEIVSISAGQQSVSLGQVTVEEGGNIFINTGNLGGGFGDPAETATEQNCCPGADYVIGYNAGLLGIEHSSLSNNHRFRGVPNTQETALVGQIRGELRRQKEIRSLDGVEEVKMSPWILVGGVEIRGTRTTEEDPVCTTCVVLGEDHDPVYGAVVRPFGGIRLDPPGWLGGAITASYDVFDTNTRGSSFGPQVSKAALVRAAVEINFGPFEVAVGAQANPFCFWEQNGGFVNLLAKVVSEETNNKYPFDPFGAWGRN